MHPRTLTSSAGLSTNDSTMPAIPADSGTATASGSCASGPCSGAGRGRAAGRRACLEPAGRRVCPVAAARNGAGEQRWVVADRSQSSGKHSLRAPAPPGCIAAGSFASCCNTLHAPAPASCRLAAPHCTHLRQLHAGLVDTVVDARFQRAAHQLRRHASVQHARLRRAAQRSWRLRCRFGSGAKQAAGLEARSSCGTAWGGTTSTAASSSKPYSGAQHMRQLALTPS